MLIGRGDVKTDKAGRQILSPDSGCAKVGRPSLFRVPASIEHDQSNSPSVSLKSLLYKMFGMLSVQKSISSFLKIFFILLELYKCERRGTCVIL